ncbi:MAG: redoxin domain-containing protein [Candidatus Thorarchaeota archaeon]|jgi:peroxiredoxin (alkyl hydroperoxide reductase subunit C)
MLLREQNVCLNVGEMAPDFSLPDENSRVVRLSDYRASKIVVLALHPGELTTGCKDHFRFYSDNLSEFEKLNAQVLAMNMASIESNHLLVEEVGDLGFPVLSDFVPLGDVTLKYDCFVPGEGYGKRAIFVIDKTGVIRYIEVLKAEGEACPDMNRVLEELRDLQ